MSTINQDNPTELLQRTLAAFDSQIAELQAKRAQIAALLGAPAAKTAAPKVTATKATEAPKQWKMSDEARARISAAAKKRWAAKKKADKAEAAAKPAEAKTKPTKAPAKKASTKKAATAAT